MLLNSFALLSALLCIGASAASSSSSAISSAAASPSSSTNTSAAPIATQTIQVGAAGLNYSPHETYAEVGDIIEFRFYPQNHSVARAAFGPTPCIPYEDTGIGRVGFYSGFRPVAVVLDNPPIYRVRVNDTEPIFFYCSAPGACLDDGMVGVINPNSTFTFAQQLNYTTNATIQFGPGEGFPTETAQSRTPSPTSTPTSLVTPTSTPVVAASSHTSLPTGAIIGIAIGGTAVVVLICALLYMCGRQKTVKEILRQSTISQNPQHTYLPTSPGLSEANYPNMSKNPNLEGGYIGGDNTTSAETESYRSSSPPIDERTGMMMGRGVGSMHPSLFSGLGSPGLVSPNSTGNGTGNWGNLGIMGLGQTHEMEEGNTLSSSGMRPYSQVHELPGSADNMSMTTHPAGHDESRPFSYTDSESGYRKGATIEKTG